MEQASVHIINPTTDTLPQTFMNIPEWRAVLEKANFHPEGVRFLNESTTLLGLILDDSLTAGLLAFTIRKGNYEVWHIRKGMVNQFERGELRGYNAFGFDPDIPPVGTDKPLTTILRQKEHLLVTPITPTQGLCYMTLDLNGNADLGELWAVAILA